MDFKKKKDFPSGESFSTFGIEKWTGTPYSMQVAGSLLYTLSLESIGTRGPEMIYHNSEEGRLTRMVMVTSLKTTVTRARPRRQV